MQSVSEWKKARAAGTPAASPAPTGGHLMSVSEWLKNRPAAPAPSPYGILGTKSTAPIDFNAIKPIAPNPFPSDPLATRTPQAGPTFQTPATNIVGNVGETNPIPLSLMDQAAGKVVQPTLPQKINSDLKDILNAPSPTRVPITPESYLNTIYGPDGTIGQGGIVGDTLKAWQKAVGDIQTASGQRGNDQALTIAHAGLDTISAFFTPVSSFFEKAATIPGPVGDAANIINKGFSMLGVVGGDSLAAAVQAAPLSEDTKAKLTPLAQEIGALAAQIVVGGAAAESLGALKEKTGTFIEKLSEDARIKELNANPVMQQRIADVTKPTVEQPKPVMSVADWQKAGKPVPRAPRATPETTSETIVRQIPPELQPLAETAKGVTPEEFTAGLNKLQRDLLAQQGHTPEQFHADVMKTVSEGIQGRPVVPEPATLTREQARAPYTPESVAANIADPFRFARQDAETLAGAFPKEHVKLFGSSVDGVRSGSKMKESAADLDVWITEPGFIEAVQKSFNENGKVSQGERHAPIPKEYSKVFNKLTDTTIYVPDGKGGAYYWQSSSAFPRRMGHEASQPKTFSIEDRGIPFDETFVGKQISEKQRPQKTPVANQTPPASPPPPTKPVASGGKPNDKLSSRVFERLQSEHPELKGQLNYDPIKLQEDASKAVDLIESNKQDAFRKAMGVEPTTDVTSTALNIAMSEKAIEEGNFKLAARMIRNRSLAQTRRGQEISAERGSVTGESTADYVKQLIASRMDDLGKTRFEYIRKLGKGKSTKGKAQERIDTEVTKIEGQIKAKKLDTKTALSLLDQLACI